MNRFDHMFASLRAGGRSALMPYVTAGDPTLSATESYLRAMAEAGADAVELGVPFSDPVADGPTIQQAAQRALAGGVRIEGIMQTVERARSNGFTLPLALLVYYNNMHRWGEARFVERAAEAGVDGFIVPDLPPESAKGLIDLAGEKGISVIPLLAPTSTDKRIRLVAELDAPFIYCIAVVGVTGARKGLSEALPPFVSRVRAVTDKPLVVGFGISGPEEAGQAAALADGVIVASALIDRLAGLDVADGVRQVRDFLGSLRRAIDEGVASEAPGLQFG